LESIYYADLREEKNMKQIIYFMTDKGVNKWIKENPDKEIIDIKFSAGGFAIIYEEKSPTADG
jgi:hypothetical protein